MKNIKNLLKGCHIPPWSKSSRNSFRKFKIVLFIKSDIVPFKVLPIDCNAFMPALDPALETFMELYCRYSHQNRLRFFHYLLSAVKTFPVMVFWFDRTEKNQFSNIYKVFTLLNPFWTQNLIQTRCCKFNSIFKTVKNQKYVQR